MTTEWQFLLQDDPTTSSASLASGYESAMGVTPELARAAVATAMAQLDSLRRAELALADGAPREALLQLVAEIEGEIAGVKCEKCDHAELVLLKAYARLLRAAAVRQ